VEDLEFHADGVVVYTDHTSLEADVVVGAFGLDEGSASFFARLTPYRPPQALTAIVTKLQPEPGSMPEFGPYIHAFLPAHPRIEFGGITPKCSHLTINIAGNAVSAPLMRSFLEHPEVSATLPDGNLDSACGPDELCIFKGRFPCSLARGYYGDRYVMVGDASGLVRAFKGKGATTAVQTAVRAAQVILQHGISREAFHQYYRKANQDIIQDLPYGHGMRTLTIALSRLGLFKFILRAAQQSPSLRTALFGAVSGHMPYREIVQLSFQPRSVLAVSREMLKLRS